MQKIHMKANINIQLTSVKKQTQIIMMTLKRILNTQMICTMFMKILKNVILEKNVKY